MRWSRAPSSALATAEPVGPGARSRCHLREVLHRTARCSNPAINTPSFVTPEPIQPMIALLSRPDHRHRLRLFHLPITDAAACRSVPANPTSIPHRANRPDRRTGRTWPQSPLRPNPTVSIHLWAGRPCPETPLRQAAGRVPHQREAQPAAAMLRPTDAVRRVIPIEPPTVRRSGRTPMNSPSHNPYSQANSEKRSILRLPAPDRCTNRRPLRRQRSEHTNRAYA